MRRALLLATAILAVTAVTAGAASAMPAYRPEGTSAADGATRLAAQLTQARLATAKYVTSLHAAKAHGYRILTKLMPGMGFHYIDPAISGFDVKKPPILVYERHGHRRQLGALEWVFPAKPATAPLPGARYGSFPAACHYADGTFIPTATQAACAPRAPKSGAAFTLWHPRLVTLHVWLWYPNPSGLFASTNPLVPAFGRG